MQLNLTPTLRAFTALAWVSIASPAWADDKILFVGNSFTYAAGGTASVPDIFTRLASAGGHLDATTVMRAVGGVNYQFHENDATTQAVIASQPWTYVILQNYSTEPTHIGSVANHITYGSLLYERVLANDPATKVLLYETWSRAAKHPLITGTSTAGTFASTDEMQAELRANYLNLKDSLNSGHPSNPPVSVAPVGDCWENAGGLLAESHPDFRGLHGSDDYHGNDNGYFLSAAVFYATIYGQSPEGLHANPAVSSLNLQLTVDATYLEKMAWDTVSGTASIAYSSQPVSLTVAENAPATFTAKVRGSPPYSVQWFRDNSAIAGATTLTYTLPNASASLNGSGYTVTVSNNVSASTSSPAILSVISKPLPPPPGRLLPTPSLPLLSNPTTISIPFNEALAAVPASNPANFSVVYHGRQVPVVSSALSGTGTAVALTLGSPIQPGFTVGLGLAIKDTVGNAMPADSVAVSPESAPAGGKFFIDFGAANTTTGPADDPLNAWNNADTTVGLSNTATINPLVDNTGVAGIVRLEMVRRFNGANSSGTLTSTVFPASATQDSLYGNSEAFSGLANVSPAFRLAGLDPLSSYTLTFYASRTGISDNRETLYTVTGAAVTSTTLNPANNVDSSTTLAGLIPSADGTLLVELSPTAQNSNAYHFIYLGAMMVSATPAQAPTFYPPVVVDGRIVLDWSGTGQLQSTSNLQGPWTSILPVPLPPYTEPLAGVARFFRLSYPDR